MKPYEFDEASLLWGRIQGYETTLTMLEELRVELQANIQEAESKLRELGLDPVSMPSLPQEGDDES